MIRGLNNTLNDPNTAPSALHYHRDYEVGSLYPLSRNGMLVNLVGKNKRVLEMGCSTGFLSKHFTANGCAVTGLERDPEAAELAAQHCDRVIVADLSHDWRCMVSGQFDVITFGDVLEHLGDPVAVLSESRELLTGHGTIIVSLPNVAFLSNRLGLLFGRWNYKDTGILDRTHLRFFTHRTARELVAAAGLELVGFHPITGLRGVRKLRWLVSPLTKALPGLLACQLILVAKQHQS